ncbi:MAG: dynamin family protein [Oscillospiraceae bacterium]|nr:dynamin family protein [Oscillospiraceae bacterium]
MEKKYDNAEYDIELVRRDLKRILRDEELCTILGDDVTTRMKKWDDVIQKKLTEPFSLVIIGDFKRGKSTVINALLGRSVAPVNVAPETFSINRFSYGEHPSVEAVLGNGKRVALTPDDLSRERLLGLLDFFPGSLEYIDVKSDAPILKELQVVDTPGLSDLDELDVQVKEFLVKADAVIYVASALSPFSESEQYFIASQIVPQNFSKIFVLINMIDAMNTMEDIDRIINHIKEKCQEIIPVAEVYGISGIDEYRRKIGLNRPDIKGFQEFYENQFLKFELALSREVIVQKDTLRTQRVFSMLEIMLHDTKNRLSMISDMMKMDREKLEHLQRDFEKECSNLQSALDMQKPKILLAITEMSQEAEYWMYEFFSKLREDILLCRTTVDVGDIQRHFYSYLMDKVGEAYRRCLEIHQERLNRYINDLGAQLSRKLGIQNLSGARVSTSDTVNVNTFVADKIKAAATQGAERSVGFPSASMPFFRNIMKKNKHTDIIDCALENYDDIRTSTIKDLKDCYKNFETYAVQQLDEMYSIQESVGRETVAQAMEMARSNESVERINNSIAHAHEIIDSALKIVSDYK